MKKFVTILFYIFLSYLIFMPIKMSQGEFTLEDKVKIKEYAKRVKREIQSVQEKCDEDIQKVKEECDDNQTEADKRFEELRKTLMELDEIIREHEHGE